MDCSDLFQSLVSDKFFCNESQFMEALRGFEVASGTRYVRTSRQTYQDGLPENLIFSYKHAQFSCSKHGAGIRRRSRRDVPTNCSAKFTVSTSGGILRIIKYRMIHNHPPDHVEDDFYFGKDGGTFGAVVNLVEDEPVVADLTKEFEDMFKQRSFSSFQELLDNMNEFMKITGCNYVMRNTVLLSEDYPRASSLIYRSVAFECYHYGSYTSYATIRPKQRTVKIGCRSKIYFYCRGNRLQVSRYEVKHNHEVRPELGAGLLRIPDGRNHRQKLTTINHQGPFESIHSLVGISEPENQDQAVEMKDNDVQWLEATSGDDIYPATQEIVLESPLNQSNRLAREELISNLEESLKNLKSLASMGSNQLVASCLQDLHNLEEKWKQSLNQETFTAEMGFRVEPTGVFQLNEELVLMESNHPSKRRPNGQDFSPHEVPDYPDSGWFCE